MRLSGEFESAIHPQLPGVQRQIILHPWYDPRPRALHIREGGVRRQPPQSPVDCTYLEALIGNLPVEVRGVIAGAEELSGAAVVAKGRMLEGHTLAAEARAQLSGLGAQAVAATRNAGEMESKVCMQLRASQLAQGIEPPPPSVASSAHTSDGADLPRSEFYNYTIATAAAAAAADSESENLAPPAVGANDVSSNGSSNPHIPRKTGTSSVRASTLMAGRAKSKTTAGARKPRQFGSSVGNNSSVR